MLDRMTHERSSGIKSGYWSPAKKEELVQRLAQYEDTGYTPEEIVTLIGHKPKEDSRFQTFSPD